MYTTLVRNRICRGSNGFLCTMCEVQIAKEEDISLHITNDEDHLIQVESISMTKSFKMDEIKSIELVNNGIIRINHRQYKCTFCPCSIPNLDHVTEHITGKKHITKRRKFIPDSEINYAMNSIISDNEDKCSEEFHPEVLADNSLLVANVSPIYCNSCQCHLETNATALYHRMFHLSQRSFTINDIISFSVKDYVRTIYCLICDFFMRNENELDNHLKENIHKKRLIILSSPSKETIVNMVYSNCMLVPNVPMHPNTNNISNTLNAEFCRYIYYLGCNLYFNAFPTIAQNNQTNNKHRELQFNANTAIIPVQPCVGQNNICPMPPEYFCFICDTKFNDETFLILHYNYDYVHHYRMQAINLILKDKNMKFVTYSNNEILKCLKCHIQLTELNSAVTHLYEVRHVMEKHIENYKIMPTVANNEHVSRSMYVCPICKINFEHDYMMVQHLESDYHRNRVQEYYTNINFKFFEKIIFFCPLCQINFFNDKKLLEHFYLRHENGMKQVIHTSNIIFANSPGIHLTANNSMVNGTNNQGMQQYCDSINRHFQSAPLTNANHGFHNSVNLNLAEQYSTVNTNKRTTVNKENNKYESTKKNYNKNLSNYSSKCVKLCIDNIFKINPIRIKKLQLGLSLTFPYNSNRGCIPCGYEISNELQNLYEHLRSEVHERNLQQLEENDEYFENCRDQYSDLELAKSYMYEYSDNIIQCLCCDSQIEDCEEIIRNHINSESHIDNYQSWRKSSDEIFNTFNNMFENLWYHIDKYFCNICCLQFDFEVYYATHLESTEHLKQVEKRILRKQSLQFDCCIICSSYWYAYSNHHTVHCSRDSHKYILKSRDFNVPEMTDMAKNMLICVEDTINNLILAADIIALSYHSIEEKILESIEIIVKSEYPQVKAYLFGSRKSFLGQEDSDVDIYLDCEGEYLKMKLKDECCDQLIKVEECFYKHQDTWNIEEIILRARVPILKLRHRLTNLNCDISFNNGLSVEKSKILGYFVQAYVPCRKLILYIRKWKTHCKLSGQKGISTFAASWLVIFYLQIKQILPSVQHLIELENKSNIIAGWETGVLKTIPVKETDLSIKDLLQGFFSYYSTFNYISDVICPLLGKVLKKRQFFDINNLPEEMNIYKNQMKEDITEFFRLDSPMCIQEPVDLSQNITKAVTKLQLRMFKQYCAESYTIMQT